MVQEFWRAEMGDMSRVMTHIKAIEYDNLEFREQNEPAYMINLEARIKSVLKAREGRNNSIISF